MTLRVVSIEKPLCASIELCRRTFPAPQVRSAGARPAAGVDDNDYTL